MTDLFSDPVYYGVDLVQIPESGSELGTDDERAFSAMILYPSNYSDISNSPIRPGKYPLVIFAHGQRTPNDGRLCPPDVERDYMRWRHVLALLARCGFVVASPAVHDVFFGGSERGAERLEATARWMYNHWQHRDVVIYPLQNYIELSEDRRAIVPEQDETLIRAAISSDLLDLDQFAEYAPIGRPAPLALVGHSWGMKMCCAAASRGVINVSALAAIAGTFDDSSAPTNFIRANIPSFLLCGSNDHMTLSYLTGLWQNTPYPKHQAAIKGVGHWDWFGDNGLIRSCDSDADGPDCTRGMQFASVMLLNFVRKYLAGRWTNYPSLLARPFGQKNFTFEGSSCAIAGRWHAPTSSAPNGVLESKEWGEWDGSAPW